MSSLRVPTSGEMLRELRPSVERGLDRHHSTASEWFPHEYIPYERGRNFVDEPWEPQDSKLPDIAQTALELNLLTEDNLPFYNLAIWTTFGNEKAWGEWVRQWVAEEGRHAIVLRDYLTVTRGLDPVALERGRMDMVKRGWYPEFAELGPLDGVVFTSLQELATRISHRNTGIVTEDPIAEKICSRIATDENLHYVFYRDLATAAFQVDPSNMLLALRRQVKGFAMPGAEMPGFHAKAKAMAAAGIYNFRIHHDQVLAPVLLKHWKITELSDLTDEAKVARDEILGHMERLDRVASKLDEANAPVIASRV
ncbi:MAG: acyl-ACP desaturase [Actinobacteria bacterium]|nr:acyl-ACP desaturase [Actinomycetota bacterium]